MPTSPHLLASLTFLVDGRRLAAEADQRLASTLDLFELAETLGYDGGWLRDHPVPLTVLAALTQRTRSLDLGVWVSAPGRLDAGLVPADLVTVDVLSRGRLRVLLGPAAGGSTTVPGEGGTARRVLLPLDSATQHAARRYHDLADRCGADPRAFDVPVLVGSSDQLLDVLTADPLAARADDLRVELPADLPADDLAQVLHDVVTYVAPELGWLATAEQDAVRPTRPDRTALLTERAA